MEDHSSSLFVCSRCVLGFYTDFGQVFATDSAWKFSFYSFQIQNQQISKIKLQTSSDKQSKSQSNFFGNLERFERRKLRLAQDSVSTRAVNAVDLLRPLRVLHDFLWHFVFFHVLNDLFCSPWHTQLQSCKDFPKKWQVEEFTFSHFLHTIATYPFLLFGRMNPALWFFNFLKTFFLILRACEAF